MRRASRPLHFVHLFAVKSSSSRLVFVLRVECAMSAVSWRRWRRAATIALTLCATAPALAETVDVELDRARIMRLPQGTSTVVIGNPLIADASLQSGGILVLTGKGYGTTNLLALDRAGQVVMNTSVQVAPPKSADVVVVYRGMQRESYSCTPECAQRITLGDSPAYFDETQKQITSRIGSGGPAPRQ
jgi:hypothetical protein